MNGINEKLRKQLVNYFRTTSPEFKSLDRSHQKIFSILGAELIKDLNYTSFISNENYDDLCKNALKKDVTENLYPSGT